MKPESRSSMQRCRPIVAHPGGATLLAMACYAALLAACAPAGLESAASETVQVIDVHVDTLPGDDEYGYVGRPVVLGSYLWLQDITNRQGDFFHVVDVATGKRIRTLGRYGAGPGEHMSVTGLFRRPGDDSTIWAWDPSLLRFTGFPADDFAPRRERIRTIAAAENIVYLAPLGPRRFVGRPGGVGSVSGDLLRRSTDSLRFTILSEDGSVFVRSAHPIPGSDRFSPQLLREIPNGAVICSKRDGSGFALTYPIAARIQLFDSVGRFVDSLQVPAPSVEVLREPDPRTREERLDRRRRSYVSCAWSDRHLFAVFLGIEDSAENPAGASELHVFDESGRLVRVVRLDAGIGSLDVDASGRRFYSATRTNVFRFELPPLD